MISQRQPEHGESCNLEKTVKDLQCQYYSFSPFETDASQPISIGESSLHLIQGSVSAALRYNPP